MTDELRELSPKAMDGVLTASGPDQFGDFTIQVNGEGLAIAAVCNGDMWRMSGQFEQHQANAAFLVALWNAYRSGQLVPASGWREIESAPKDNSKILVTRAEANGKNPAAIVRWSRGKAKGKPTWRKPGGAALRYQPTHWMYPPTPPNQSPSPASGWCGIERQLEGIASGLDESSARFYAKDEPWPDDHIRTGNILSGFATAIRQTLKSAPAPSPDDERVRELEAEIVRLKGVIHDMLHADVPRLGAAIAAARATLNQEGKSDDR